MKKLFTLISLCSLTGFGFGQAEIRLIEGGLAVGNDVSGTTHEAVVEPSDLSPTIIFEIKNTSGSTQNWSIMRYRVNMPPTGWTDHFSWGPYPDNEADGRCYSSIMMTTNPWTNPHPMPIETNGRLMVDIYAEDPGCGHYRYIIMDGSTKIDSVDLEVCYVLGVDEQEEVAGMTAYPNPANGLLTVATTGMDGNYEIRVTDVLGKVVYNETASGAKKNVDVSEFKNGVYLVTVLDRGVVIQTRRVVVKH